MAVTRQLVVFGHLLYLLYPSHSSNLGTCLRNSRHSQGSMEESRSLAEEPIQVRPLVINVGILVYVIT